MCEVMDVGFLPQCLCISNHYSAYFKSYNFSFQLYVNKTEKITYVTHIIFHLILISGNSWR